jgi:phospholipid/cholesterol/gamma-HCH transport system substrate-binding protein
MEKTVSEKIRLGLFVIVGLLIFVLAVYFIGEKQKMFGQTDQLNAVFNNVNGLQLGNNVRYSGINIGTVRGIEMVNDTTIRVKMVIEKSVFSHIRKDAIASIGSDGLVGNMIVNITPGIGTSPLVKSNDQINSVNRIRTDDVLNTLNTTNQNIAQITSDLLKITKTIQQGKGTLGLLINDTLMGSDVKKSLEYIKKTGEGTTETVAKLNQLMTSLNQNNNVIGVLKDSAVANKIKVLVDELVDSGKKVTLLIDNANATVTQIKEGEGAINYLSTNADFTKKLDSTMTNINQASYRLNENLEALKHNFLFRKYFKKK